MRKIIIMFGMLVSSAFTQDLTGIKICIDAGHGGHESDDRHILATDFWESESNLTKALELDVLLSALGADVLLTRYANDDNVADDPSLSQRVAIANQFSADFFHSIHSNGYNGERNSTLMLFQGFDNDPTWDEAKELSDIMAVELYDAHRTTAYSVRGDFDFYGTGEAYLGVLKGLTMPGTLSEGSFHDYIPESWRLQNLDYRKHESWAIARSLIAYYTAGSYGVGEIAGVVRNNEMTVDYFYLTATNDAKAPVNDITVTVTPGDLIYYGDELNNGFFLFDSLSPGQYKVVFEATNFDKDSITITVTANQTIFADCWLTPDSNWVAPPEIPENIRVHSIDDTSIRIDCAETARADSYIAYISTDGIAFVDSVVAPDSSILITGLTENQPYYFKLKTKNGTGTSSTTKKVYGGAPSSGDLNILLVNGFDRSTNTSNDYVRFYGTPITANGYGFSYCLNEEVYQDRISLLNYDVVVWALGDESTLDETFNSVEQDRVEAYLKAGGYLFVSGAEIGWDLEAKGTTSDIAFYHNYLKADYIADAPDNKSATYYSATAVPTKIFSGISDVYFDNGTHGTVDIDWPDAIAPYGGSETIMIYKGATQSNIAAVAFEGTFPAGSIAGKLIHMAFPFETIYNVDSRIEVMTKVLGFFNGTNVAVEDQLIELREIALRQNYPNPFNPVTNISFTLSRTDRVMLAVYDISGRLVKTITCDDYKAGQHFVQWDGTNNVGESQASGIYFYRLTATDINLSRRMTLLK
ncbi:MAG: N-acetylmuramoyl-L-alanine amidase [Candidatus Neomarinimicrobiota bacterium]